MNYTTKEGAEYANDNPLKQYNFIEIPDNATNGDVIKTLFPNVERCGVVLMDNLENIIATNVNLGWWNAPYKREGE